MAVDRPILITGTHRSGTTWVGKIFGVCSSVYYIPEIFNPNNRNCSFCRVKFPYLFTYVWGGNQELYYEHIRHSIGLSYKPFAVLGAIRSLQDLRKRGGELKRFLAIRSGWRTPLIKDPIALLSAEWLATTFAVRVLVMIRHPAAFVSSLKRLNWRFSFDHFLKQPQLMRDYLYPFEKLIEDYAANERDIIDQGALLWKILHYVIAGYQERHPDWIFLRHEDISCNPPSYFKDLFARLGLPFTQEVAETIKIYSDSSNPKEAPPGVVHFLRRNSRANIYNWKTRLTSAEIIRVREQVEDISRKFYSDEDW